MKTAISGARVKSPQEERNFLKHSRQNRGIPRTSWRSRPCVFPKARLALSCPVCLLAADSMGSPEQTWEEGEVPPPCTLLRLSLCCPFMVLPHGAEAGIGRWAAWQPSPPVKALSPQWAQMSSKCSSEFWTCHLEKPIPTSDLAFKMVFTCHHFLKWYDSYSIFPISPKA